MSGLLGAALAGFTGGMAGAAKGRLDTEAADAAKSKHMIDENHLAEQRAIMVAEMQDHFNDENATVEDGRKVNAAKLANENLIDRDKATHTSRMAQIAKEGQYRSGGSGRGGANDQSDSLDKAVTNAIKIEDGIRLASNNLDHASSTYEADRQNLATQEFEARRERIRYQDAQARYAETGKINIPAKDAPGFDKDKTSSIQEQLNAFTKNKPAANGALGSKAEPKPKTDYSGEAAYKRRVEIKNELAELNERIKSPAPNKSDPIKHQENVRVLATEISRLTTELKSLK